MRELGLYSAHRSSIALAASSGAGYDVVHLAGQLDLHTSSWAKDRMVDHAGLRQVPLVLDLGALDLLDSSGIRALVLLHRALTERGTALAFVTDSAHLRKLFRISGLDQVIPVHDGFDQLAASGGGDGGSEPATAG